jgi:hypothetical protein
VRGIIKSLNAGKVDEALRGVADDFEIDWSTAVVLALPVWWIS